MGDFGVEIIFLDYTKLHLSPEEGHEVIMDLKAQIRARPWWGDRSEIWEGYETRTGIYKDHPEKEGRIYSFDKEHRLLLSRMTPEEKREINGSN